MKNDFIKSHDFQQNAEEALRRLHVARELWHIAENLADIDRRFMPFADGAYDHLREQKRIFRATSGNFGISVL